MSSTADEMGTATTILKSLEAPETGFRVLAAGLPHACFHLTPALEIDFANAELTELLGVRPRQVLGRHIGDVLGAGQRDEHIRRLELVLGGDRVVYDCSVATGDGRPLDLRISSKPVLDGHGCVIGILAEAVDITELKRLELEARENETRFRLIAEGVPNQLLLLDRDLRIEFANDVFLEASGWSADAACGRHISEVTGVDRFHERRDFYERALRGETVSYEAAGAAGSRSGYFRFAYRPSFDENGNVCGLLTTATDISGRRRAELELESKQAELLRSNKDLEQFAYVASHDLKAPLRAIEVLVSWIKDDLAGHEIGDVQDNLGLLTRRTQRLGRLLDDLLAYSRAGRKVGKHGEVDCHALVLDAIQLVDPPAAIEAGISGRLPTFETYAAPLEQVFRNLIGNAIKHHPGPEGRVTVSCAEHDDCYVFAVEDDGAGIEPEYAERVFQMFQTLKPRDSVEGSGMGLAIVDRIVRWQGGRVWFEPGDEGRGAVFRFEWRKQLPESIEVTT